MNVYERKAVQNIKSNDTEKWKRTLKISEKKMYRMLVNLNRRKFSVYIHVSLNRANTYSYMEFPFEMAI